MPDAKNLIIAAAVVLATAVPRADAGDVAWDKAIGADAGKLNDIQRSRAAALLKKIQNTRGCEGTLTKCLAAGDRTAARHAGYVIRQVRREKPDGFIERHIELRHRSAFPDETYDIDLADHPRRGSAGAAVEVVEYACFQCPFCADLAPKMKRRFKKEFGDKVAHYYKFFPVRSHEHGVSSALAGLAAHRQGEFWKLYDILYAHRHDLGDDELRDYAEEAGLDMERFEKDIEDPAAMRFIEKDKLEGMRFGVEGTPTFFVNGKLYRGQNDIAELLDRIGEELDILEGRIQ